MGESLRLLVFAAVELVALTGTLLCVFFSLLGIKGLDGAFTWLRVDADRQRHWASRTGKHQLEAEYQSFHPTEPGGLEQLRAKLSDPATARDLDWHLINPVVSTVGAFIPWALFFNGWYCFGLFVIAKREGLVIYLNWWFSEEFPSSLVLLFSLAAAQLIGAPLVARLLQRVHRRWVRFMLTGDVSDKLEERLRTLTSTRMTALDMQEAEIQRIERDLHDGAQARLVTIGMTVTQASRLMKHDPDAALSLLDDVKNDSTTALQELRTLVRGIRPPVLADRGLPDAIRALAATNPIDTTVSSSLEERLVGSVESALFFAVSELMTNSTKHSAGSHIAVELRTTNDDVVLEVVDDGIGGAEGQESPGGGIAGIRRRLAPFDGTLDVVSPVGGGTYATIRVPHPSS